MYPERLSERIVWSAPASTSLRLRIGVEARLDGRQPDRPRPHPRRPEPEGGDDLAPRGDPPGGENGDVGVHRPGGVDDLGDEGEGPDLPGVPGGVGPLGDDDVGAGRHRLEGVAGLADEGDDRHPVVVHLADHVGGAPQPGGEDPHLLLVEHVEHLPDELPGERRLGDRALRVGDRVLLLDRPGEAPVLLGDHRRHRLGGRLVGHRGGEDEIDPEGPVPDGLLHHPDPFPESLGPLRVVAPSGAEHADPAGVRHRRRHLRVVGEGEDRVLAPEALADNGLQRIPGHGRLPR